MDTEQRSRYEIPAVIVVDAIDDEDAATRARNLATTLAAHEGPGAFFYEIGLAAVADPIRIGDFPKEKTHAAMSVAEHAASLVPDSRAPGHGAEREMATSDGLGAARDTTD